MSTTNDINSKGVYLLDCTLRDGGYVNDWIFGKKEIGRLIYGLEKTNVEILELGFLRDTESREDSTSFGSIPDINKLIQKKKGIIYAAMIGLSRRYPVEKLPLYSESGVDLLRVCVQKSELKDHLNYAKKILEKGYRITIQPSRVDQYTDLEFIDMLKRSNDLHPFAVYVVDTWGNQSSWQIQKYLELADRYLDKDIKVGYHGHDNKKQALACALATLDLGLNRDICLDSSIMGMGRGAGNLNTELIMEYLNGRYRKTYDTEPLIGLYESCLKPIYEKTPWGYSLYFFIAATHECNSHFATYFSEQDYGEDLFLNFIKALAPEEKVTFNKDFVERKLQELHLK